jgi:hypothetical protein
VTDSPAAELRQAALLMRERAEKAERGPWFTAEHHGRDIADEGWSDLRVTAAADAPPVAIAYLTGITEPDLANENAVHIASWHPGAALAVADWLDAEAERAEVTGFSLHSLGPGALAVARAYLGENR